MDMSIAARIARGAEYLDQFYPGWAASVNLETLDMRNSDCVLGQATGDWGESVDLLGLRSPIEVRRQPWYTPAQAHGFNVVYSTQAVENAEWDELDRKWRELITARRQA